MANFNKVIMIGNLTRDPQMSYLPSQTPVVEFGLAVNRRWRGKDNQQKEDVCFIDCRSYGKQAETINQYMNKGKPILVEGRLQFDQWEGKDGVKRSKHRLIVEQFQFLGSAGGSGGQAGGARAPQGQRPQPQAEQAPAEPPSAEEEFSEPPPPEEEAPGGEHIPF
ncbi:MAG: single-stranded DNA-binding protein [Planctomycetes bacterium]|nr:single-stranded DNA-binding protein [Planctomycetota bacterium]